MSIKLPTPNTASSMSLDTAIAQRRSCRSFTTTPLELITISKLLWAMQGITGEQGQRAAPSAGAQYPSHVYLAAGNVTGLSAGIYRYHCAGHRLEIIHDGDSRESLADAALEYQPWVKEAAVVVALTADVSAMYAHFLDQPPQGQRGDRYIYLEAGAITQNAALQAANLNLGAVLVGGFDDDKTHQCLQLPQGLAVTALVCIGNK